ncbi:YegP family protein [Kaarinaea lacus]
MSNGMASSFVLKQNENGEIYFNFLNSDGEVVLISGEYPDKTMAEEAIKDVKLNSLMSQQLAAGKTKDGAQFFVIKGTNGDILVKSALYTSQMVMDNALHCVKDNVCVAEVMDLTS